MCRSRYLIAMLGLSLVVVQAAPVAAAAAGWMVNGSTLTGTAALANTAAVEAGGFEFIAAQATVHCSSNAIRYINPVINGRTGMASLALAEFKECAGNTVCPLGEKQGNTLTTLPLLVDVTLQSALAIKGVFLSTNSSKALALIEFGGSECSFAGHLLVTGSQGFLALAGQDERTPQLLQAETLTPGELKLASTAITLKGAAALQLASGLPSSFL